MIVRVGKIEPTVVTPWLMKIGQIGRILSGSYGYEGIYVLRTYSGIVSLNKPSDTWDFRTQLDAPLLNVELFPSGTEIIITTEV